MINTKDKEDMLADSWCLKNNIIIGPILTKDNYGATVRREGRSKKVTLPKVKIEIKIDGSKKVGTKVYKQDSELWDKIKELKTYYWHASKDYINYLKSLI